MINQNYTNQLLSTHFRFFPPTVNNNWLETKIVFMKQSSPALIFHKILLFPMGKALLKAISHKKGIIFHTQSFIWTYRGSISTSLI